MYNQMNRIISKTVTNVADAFRPLFWLNGILGLTVLEIPSGHPWLKLSIFYAIGRSIAYGLLLWYGVFIVPIKQYSNSIMTWVFRVILFFNVGIAAISTVLGLLNYKKIKRFFKKITLADETLQIYGIDPEYTLAFKENIQMVLTWCFGGLIIFSSDLAVASYVFHNIYYVLVNIIMFEYPLLMNTVVELNFAVKISILGKRFERLNLLIQSITTNSLKTLHSQDLNKNQHISKRHQSLIAVKPNYYFKTRNNIELLLKTARQLHLDLCATSREVNDIYSKQLSSQMAATFILLTGFSYCFYLVYNELSIPLSNKIEYYTTFGVWIIISITRMIHVVRTSVRVTTEAQKTSQIAHEIQVSQLQSKLIDEIHQLSLQIMQHPLSFTASGLIVLDFGCVRGFVGSVTTYLMILIQNESDMLKAVTLPVENSTLNCTNTTIDSLVD